MRRITRLLNKLDPSKNGVPQQFYETLLSLKLAPGEQIPDLVPPKSWIFVEDGFLLLRVRSDNRWICQNIYYEGTSTAFYNVGAAQLKEGSFLVEAVEHSTVYYLSPADEIKVESFFPQFSLAQMRLDNRSYRKHQERSIIFDIGVQRRIQIVERHFPVMLRAPVDDLAEMLNIKSKRLKMALISAHRKYHSRNNQ